MNIIYNVYFIIYTVYYILYFNYIVMTRIIIPKEDFLESVKYRTPFTLNESNGHRSCTIINLGKIALQLGRTLNFDPEAQVFINDDEANKMINPPMRAPYGI